MNTYTFKNRGMFLEKILNDSNMYYIEKNRALIFKKATPVKVLNVSYPNEKVIINKAVFESPSTLDYNGLYRGKYIEFDAKETKNKTSFPLSNIKQHQIKHIRNVIAHGGVAFLIIYMSNEFYLLKGTTLIEFIDSSERKSIPIEFIKDASYKIDEKYIPRLDYLKTVDEIYFKE